MDNKIILVVGGFFPMLLFGSPQAGSCRENVLSGSLAMRQEYDSNVFRQDSDRESQWLTVLAPQLTFVSTGEKDAFSLAAGSGLSGEWGENGQGEENGQGQGFVWNHRLDEGCFGQSLLFSGNRQVSQHFRVTVSDNYNYYDNAPQRDMDPRLGISERFQRASRYEQAEIARLLFPELHYTSADYLYVLTELERRYAFADPASQREVDRYLSNTEGRRRYWDNEFTVGTEYEFSKDSLLTLGYRYFGNDDRSAGISEYYEHSPSVGLSYRFNEQWLASVRYTFTKGQYDTTNDISAHDTLLTVNFALSPQDQLIASYEYETERFQGTKENITEHIGELSWNHNLSAETNLTTTLSENYLAREFAGDENDVYLDFHVTRRLQRGSVSVGAGGLLGQQKREGSWEKLRRNWSVDGAVSYLLLEKVTGTFDLSYEKRYLWPETSGKADYDDYEAGLSVTYSFLRWFALTCRYAFNRLESNNTIVSGYDEHLMMVELSVAKELIRW